MSKTFWAVIAAIVVLFGAVLIFNKNGSTPDANGAAVSNHLYGDGKTSVKLVEYGDYQCPACYKYEAAVEQIRAKYKEDITFQFVNLPLTQLHQNAFAAARAAEAASLQGKFWEMHDLLYQNQPTWAEASSPQSYFEQYAQQLDLNVEQFKKDAASSKVNDTINADMAAFRKTGEQLSTPTFFLNGKKVTFTPDVNSFIDQLDPAISAAKSAQQPAQ